MCDGVLAFCFENAMAEDYDQSQCQCLQDCEEFVYELSAFQNKVPVESQCDLRSNWNQMSVQPVAITYVDLKKHFGDNRNSYDLPTLIGEKLRWVLYLHIKAKYYFHPRTGTWTGLSKSFGS